MTIYHKTNLLGIVRANLKAEYWTKVVNGEYPLPAGKTEEYAKQRLEYWSQQIVKYRQRIDEHIRDFRNKKKPIDILDWISSVIDTIKEIILKLDLLK